MDHVAAAGIGVLVLRHARKGGGVIGESARGSSALTVLSPRHPSMSNEANLPVISPHFNRLGAITYAHWNAVLSNAVGDGTRAV